MIKKITFCYRFIMIILLSLYYSIRVILLFIIGGNKSIFYKLIYNWADKLLKSSKINLIIEGENNILSNKSYIIISNHASLFDIPILIKVFHGNLIIMYKKELEKVPVFGWGLKVSPLVAVARQEPRNAMASIDETVKSLNKDISTLVFPEGTRSIDGKVGEFKRGAFMIATKSEKPILPISIIGSAKILQTGRYYFNEGNVIVNIHQEINVDKDIDRNAERELIGKINKIIKDSVEKFA